MSYQIQYHGADQFEKKYSRRNNQSMRFVIVILCAVMLTISVYFFETQGLTEFIVPGDNTITVSAFNEMKNNLKDGMAMKDALTAFCQLIINSAN